MKIVVTILVFTVFLNQVIAYNLNNIVSDNELWEKSQSNTDYNLRSIHFLNSRVGYVLGHKTDTDKVFKTYDEGKSWKTVAAYYKRNLNNVFFLNDALGFLCSDSGCYYETTNEGVTWNLFNIGTTKNLIQMIFLNRDSGIAISSDSVFVTQNSGVNWSRVGLSGDSVNLTKLVFINNEVGFISSKRLPATLYWINGYIFKTTNSGLNWDTCLSTYNILTSTDFLSEDNGLCIGGITSYNTGAGCSGWVSGNATGILGYDCVKVSEMECYAAGYNFGNAKVSISTNAGAEWLQDLYIFDPYNEIKFNNITYKNNIIWVSGDLGLIYKKNLKVKINTLISEIPQAYLLYQNYPNPFNPYTKIRFDIPSNRQYQSQDVMIVIYDALGKEVVVLVNGKFNPGSYEVSFEGSNLPSGIYFYKLEAGGFSETKRMILIK